MTIRVNSQFAGCGLFDLGLQQAGLHIQHTFEIDPACCATINANFSHNAVPCDLTGKLAAREADCDVMAITYPCNTYSAVAAIHGKRTGDALFLHSFRHIALRRPEIYVAENVPGMKKFPVVMEAMTRLPDYYVKVFCPVSSQTWLPQRRDRLIILASRRNFAWRPPKSGRRVHLKDILEEHPQVEIPSYVYKRLNGAYRDQPIISDPRMR